MPGAGATCRARCGLRDSLKPCTCAPSTVTKYQKRISGPLLDRIDIHIEVQLKNGWVAWLIASFFLAAQHMFLPLILDWDFILWRLGMFLPFALFTGLFLKLRPALLPYFVIVHALMDVSTMLVYLMI